MSRRAAAAVGCSTSDTNHVAKKRRRWSTAHQEVVLSPNRFGAKKQLTILGRHHPSSSSVNSLASFQSKSNPIFEPGDEEPEPSYSSNNNNSHEAKWNVATLVDGSRRGGRGGGGCGADSQQHPHPKLRSRLGKTSPESSAFLSIPASGGGGDWSPEEKVDNVMENPIMLLHSPAINGKRAFHGLLKESRAISRDCGEGEWPDAVEGREEEGPNERDSRVLGPSLRSSDDGGQSIEGPRCIIGEDGPQEGEEMLSSLAACERRSRELVEKVQANAAADLAQLRSYKAIIEHLRVECAKHEAAAKEWSDMHRDAMAQLVSARAEISELEGQRSLQALAIEELKQKQGIEKDLKDAISVSDRLKLETLEKEQDGWRQKVEALEMEVMVAKSEVSAAYIREEEQKKETQAHERDVAIQNEVEIQVETVTRGEIETGSNNTTLESASEKLREVEEKLTTLCKQMQKLQQERDELKIQLQIAGQDGERRVAEAEKDRDAVVLAVQQEWDSVKVALRQEKEKLEHELTSAWEQNTKLLNELESKNKALEAGKRNPSRNPADGGEAESLQHVYIGDNIVQAGTERGDSLIALWQDYQKLEAELSEAFDHNKKQRNDREALNVVLVGVREGNKKLEGEREALIAALIVVRDGNKKLEGELSDLHLENTKLEKERDALMMTVQEERQKLENERAEVCKAMRGENEKLESEREVLIAMQDYLKKLEMKQDKAQTVEKVQTTIGGDEKRRRKGKRGAPQS
ncbi:unnamed protein product [Calypogeia fissa]